jgi:hypothetical protein
VKSFSYPAGSFIEHATEIRQQIGLKEAVPRVPMSNKPLLS